MVYLAGDTHGYLDMQKVADFFETESLRVSLTKDDSLIILGDVGVCWDNGKNDAWVRRELQKLPVTTLWLDGNHENFPLIWEYPVKKWHGGCVHMIEIPAVFQKFIVILPQTNSYSCRPLLLKTMCFGLLANHLAYGYILR